MDTPRVSIIIPIYKTEKYLRDCLLSVQRQTMPDFEALMVNDCTPDGAMQIASEFVQADPRFRILEHEANQGLGCARNTGIAAARCEYLNFLDSDDKLPADAMQVLLELAGAQQADMVIGNMAWIRDNHLSEVKYIRNHIRSWTTYWTSNLRSLPDDACFTGSVCNRLISTQLVREHALVFPEKVYYEDIPFTMEAWFHSMRVAATSRFVYFRTQRNDRENLSLTQIYTEKAFLDRDVIARRVFDFARQQNGAARLGSITLLRILSTSKAMLASANDDIKLKMTTLWFPLHALRINMMVNELNGISAIIPCQE